MVMSPMILNKPNCQQNVIMQIKYVAEMSM